MSEKTGVIIKTDGTMAEVSLGGSVEAELDALQTAVGGYVQAVDMHGVTMWLNEEGKLTGLPVNDTATVMWVGQYGPSDIIVGDVVITGPTDEDGDTTSVDLATVEGMAAVLASVS